jgi:hypothetical protein
MRKLSIGVVLATALVLAPGGVGADSLLPPAEEAFAVQLVSVDTPTRAAKDLLTSLPLDLTEHGDEHHVDVVLHSPADADLLGEHGFTWTVEIPDLAARDAENRRADLAFAAANPTTPLPSGRNAYRHLADYEAELRALPTGREDFVRTFELPHESLEGRKVLGVEISEDVHSTTDGKPVFLMLGLHHAREWPSGEHAMEFAIDLVEGFENDNERIKGLLGEARVLVVPVVNPDGFEQSRKWGDIADLRELDDTLAENGEDSGGLVAASSPGNAYKRKNCRMVDGQAPPPGSCEAPSPIGFGAGIDLNRNYGALWGGGGSSGTFANPTYRGPAPFSEPETQNVRDLVSSRHVTTLITNHTYSNLILRPPGTLAAGETIDEPAMKELGARMAEQNGYRNIHGWQLYDTDGTTEDWSYNATGGYGYTFEIGPDEFHPPFEEVVDEYVGAGYYAGKGNAEAFLLALENAVDPAHHSVLAGMAPAGAMLRLTKEFETATSVEGLTVSDRLDSTLQVPEDGRFEWHVNPSTRPEVMEHRVRILSEEPTGEPTEWNETVVWRPGDHVDLDYTITQENVGALRVNLDWGTPDDLDLYVYEVRPDGALVEVGSSGNFVNEKEEALVELPVAGDYVIRVVNYASVSPSFTVTAGLYAIAGEDVFGGGVVEHYTLTCEDADGNVLETAQVTVDRGKTQKVSLNECARALRTPPRGRPEHAGRR